MAGNNLTRGSYFRLLNILHAAMLGGQLFFAIIAYYLVLSGNIEKADEKLLDFFKLAVPIITLVFISGSYLLFRNSIRNIKLKKTLFEKLLSYRTALILKYAMLEAPSLIAIVGFMLTSNRLFLIFAGLIIFIFLLNKPSLNSLAFDLGLAAKEREKLDDPASLLQ